MCIHCSLFLEVVVFNAMYFHKGFCLTHCSVYSTNVGLMALRVSGRYHKVQH